MRSERRREWPDDAGGLGRLRLEGGTMKPIREAIAAAFAVIAHVEPLQAQKGVSGYECMANHAYMLEKDDLVKKPQRNFYTIFKEIDPKATYYFAVDRATGRMSGYLNSKDGKALVFDDASIKDQSYKAAYHSDPGLYVTARYLIIRVYDSGPSKGFLLTDNDSVVTGTCTLVPPDPLAGAENPLAPRSTLPGR
jgi:hypothetical protein